MEVGERLVLEVIEKGSAEEILMAKPKPKPEPQPGNNCPINSGTCNSKNNGAQLG